MARVSAPFVAGVVEEDFFAQAGAVDVGVDLGGGYAFVAEHGLDGAEVGSALEEVGGEGVAEGVGRDVAGDARLGAEFLDEVEDHDSADVFDAALDGDEDVVLVFGRYLPLVAVEEVELEFLDGLGGDGHEALFGSLALDADELFVEIEIGEF